MKPADLVFKKSEEKTFFTIIFTYFSTEMKRDNSFFLIILNIKDDKERKCHTKGLNDYQLQIIKPRVYHGKTFLESDPKHLW